MRVAVCQLNPQEDRRINLDAAIAALTEASSRGADLAVLPELVDYMGPAATAPKPEPCDGEFAALMAEAARSLRIWVHAGSFRESGPDETHAYNTSLVFDRDGQLAATYRKIHLYDVEIPGRVSYRESATVAAGTELVSVEVEGVGVGLSLCYDLRFPELYRALAVGGATVLIVPAAFMTHTGRDHWEVLLRARAIENQCWVVAAGQIGPHEPGRLTYGRSMVVDPWGTVIAQAPDTVGVTIADLDLGRVATIRAELPSLANRRLL
jgi:predicted amidohydrolase